MTTQVTGRRIRHARRHAGLTIEQLAQWIGASERSVKRYENDQSTPDTHTLAQLARVLDLSADYLLGLSDQADPALPMKQRRENVYYRRVQRNQPFEGQRYYWVEYDPDEEGIPTRGQMQWAGFGDAGEELYSLRPINVERCRALIAGGQLPGRADPLIVNSLDDYHMFLYYGGDAFVAEPVCRECLPYLLRPGAVKPARRSLDKY